MHKVILLICLFIVIAGSLELTIQQSENSVIYSVSYEFKKWSIKL